MEIPASTHHFPYDSIFNTFGITLDTWDKKSKSYLCGILSLQFKFQISEAKKVLNSSASIEDKIEKTNEEDPQSRKIDVVVTTNIRQFKVLEYSKRYIGRKYKHPVVFSIIHLEGDRVIGIRASFFHLENIKTYSAFIVFNSRQSSVGNVIKDIKKEIHFAQKTLKVAFNHIFIRDCLKFEARKSRDSPKSYRFDKLNLIPFEMILSWHYEKLHLSKLSLLSAGSKTDSSHVSNNMN